MRDYKFYTDLNKLQPVKRYTKAEIEAYTASKPDSFFTVPSYAERKLERWLDEVFPKTCIDEVLEAEYGESNHQNVLGDDNNGCNRI